jgi:hypothetical protein
MMVGLEAQNGDQSVNGNTITINNDGRWAIG